MTQFYNFNQLTPDWPAMERHPVRVSSPEAARSDPLIRFRRWYDELRQDESCLHRSKVTPRALAPILAHVSLFDLLGEPLTDFRFRVLAGYPAAVLGEKTGKLASEAMTPDSFKRWCAAFAHAQAHQVAMRFSAPTRFTDALPLMGEMLVVPVGANGQATQLLGSYSLYQDDDAIIHWPWGGDYLIIEESPIGVR